MRDYKMVNETAAHAENEERRVFETRTTEA